MSFLLTMYFTIHNKIRFMIRKIVFPIHDLNLDLITLLTSMHKAASAKALSIIESKSR